METGTRRKQVPEQLDYIDNQINILTDKLEELYKRLADGGVINPRDMDPPMLVVETKESEVVELAAIIRGHGRSIATLTDKVELVTRLLEI